ncbi:MAG: hypothetical protein H2212_00180 [Ruminococcus sp.]|nr:hypothetical protein [Ruminococcus sp.]
MGDYENFISKYFPQASIQENAEGLYNLVCESNIVSAVFLRYMDTEKYNLTEEKKLYYIRFRDAVNKLLFYVPLNDGIGIFSCMRYLLEQYLKFIYAIHFDIDISKINITSYRHIKEDIKESYLIDQKVKEKIERIYSFYAKYSNDVHDKDTTNDNELTFLEDILKGKNAFWGTTVDDLRKILDVTYDILECLFEINFEDLNSVERMKISKMKSRKRSRKILKLLNRQN